MNLGPTEIIVLAVLVIVLFGAKKLPELGSSVGKTITNFRKGMTDAEKEAAAQEGRDVAASESVDTTES